MLRWICTLCFMHQLSYIVQSLEEKDECNNYPALSFTVAKNSNIKNSSVYGTRRSMDAGCKKQTVKSGTLRDKNPESGPLLVKEQSIK